MLEITTENLEGLQASELPLVIDFWAEWCAPCKAVSPLMNRFADEYAGRVNIGKCDVEENDDLVVRYAIRSLPTILFIKKGEIVEKVVGSVSCDVIEQGVRKLIE